MNAKALQRTVRWARRRAGMTQHDLAKALGMPQPSIARIEAGTVIPRTASLLAILEATGHQLTVEPIGPAVDLEAIRHRLRLNHPQRTKLALGRAGTSRRTSPMHILRRLRRFGVPFVLIGELAEAAHGSPTSAGRDVEVVLARTDVAQQRLATAREDLADMSKRLTALTETAAGDDYDRLKRNAVPMLLDPGILVPVAALEDLIAIRRAEATPEDRAAAAVLRAIGPA